MAKVAAHTTRIFFDEFQLSSALSSFAQAVEQETPDITSFEDAGPRRVVGNYDHNLDIAGLFDGDAGEIDEIIDAAWRDGADHNIAIFPGASAAGSTGREGVYKLDTNAPGGAVGGAVLLAVTAQGSAPVVRAHLLENSSKTGTGTGTGRNVGITTSPAITAVTARIISGTFSALDFDIQGSSDDGGGDAYTDISGLDFAFTAVGVTRKTITATTEAWKRVNIDVFTGTSALLVVTIGNAPT